MKYLFILLFVFLYNVLTIHSADVALPDTITLSSIIFDHHPWLNQNFEGPIKDTKGLVQKNLDSVSKVPVLVTSKASDGGVVDPSTFQYFFNSKPGMNIPISQSITLNKGDDGITYTFDGANSPLGGYFPINNQGWDAFQNMTIYKNSKGEFRNFHFCFKLNSQFTYRGVEVFNFVGDDDVWLFINNKLAVDLGGVHGAQTGSVDLQTLGLTVGTAYSFDFFFCERHTTESNVKIQTSILVTCPTVDYCGICLGDGSTCCQPSQCTGASTDKCNTYTCPKPSLAGVTSSNYKDMCTKTPVACTESNQCYNGQCTTNVGCQYTKVTCPDKSSTCQIPTGPCVNSTGCSYQSKCTGVCDSGACLSGSCVQKTCIPPVPDKCKIYSCDPVTGCKTQDKCTTTNPCQIPSCSSDTGACSYAFKPGCTDCSCPNLTPCQVKGCNISGCDPQPKVIDDGNACTDDACNITTGVVTHTPKNICTGSCQTCDELSGNCNLIESLCEDGNICTSNKCDAATGNCTTSATNCDDSDACTIDTCDQFIGCLHTRITCGTATECQVAKCDKVKGCYTTPKVCTSEFFCLDTRCDDRVGCITFDKECVPDNPRCEKGFCNNQTKECTSKNFDPLPFVCNTKAVVSTAVIAGVTVAGAVAVALAVFGGKKGYDYWKESRGQKLTVSSVNPLFEASQNSTENPMYADQ